MDLPQSPAPSREAPRPFASYRLPLLLLVLLILATVAFLPTYLEQVKYKQTKGEVAALREAMPDLKVGSLGKLFTLVARTASPAVVHIDTEGKVRVRSGLFGEQLLEQQGQGSGVIVDPEGYIVTNYHVIEIARSGEISVKLADGRHFTAQTIGEDAENDIAVLKIDADHLVSMPWGDSDQLETGEFVWAIGNPFGLDNTLTFGVVSAKDRRGLNRDSRYQQYIQTDAAVNPGNSGGPLVNMSGQIVGINAAIVGPTFQGISFSIPSNVAQRLYRQIRENGSVVKGYLGVGTAALNPRLAAALGINQLEGALVVQVGADSPAEKAGLEPKDLIIAWNGDKVQDPPQLAYFIAQTAPGTMAKITVIRDGQKMEVEVTVGRKEPD
jgi:S1-C subfamily serine protease